MEAIYLPDLSEISDTLLIPVDEAQHLKALRAKVGDKIQVINGKGIFAECEILDLDKKKELLKVINIRHNVGEHTKNIAVGIGILDNRERFEFALEKAVELGVNHFIPLITEFSQKKTVNIQRLEQKAIAAMKQCKRSKLMKIYNPIKFKEITEISKDFEIFVLTDENGVKPTDLNVHSVMLFVGPEGGFSEFEINTIKNMNNIICWNLGNRRLRAETALISGISFLI